MDTMATLWNPMDWQKLLPLSFPPVFALFHVRNLQNVVKGIIVACWWREARSLEELANKMRKTTFTRAVTLGLADASPAGDEVNINRPKVMGACVIMGLSSSPPAGRPVHSPHLLYLSCPLGNCQAGGRWAGTLGDSPTACCSAATVNQECQTLLHHISILPSRYLWVSGIWWPLNASVSLSEPKGMSIQRAVDGHDGIIRSGISLHRYRPQHIPLATAGARHQLASLPSSLPLLRASSPIAAYGGVYSMEC